VLTAKKLTIADIDEVLLVGGQSRSPIVWRKLEAHFGKRPNKGVHPDEVVALGAGLLADSLHRAEKGVLLIDVLPISIGLALPGGGYARVVPRNTPLPCEKKFTIATTRDSQTEIMLVVLQGEGEQFAANDYLGSVRFSGLKAAPRGQNQLHVTFSISNESILTITARELLTGREMTAQIDMKDVPEGFRPRAELTEEVLQQAVVHPAGEQAPAPAAPIQAPPAAALQPAAPAAHESELTREESQFAAGGGFFSRLFKRLFGKK
jgi:molecular chaperone DnaK